MIGSAYLREAWLDAVEHAAEARSTPPEAESAWGSGEADDVEGVAVASDDAASRGAAAAADVAPSRYATLDEAVADADRQLSRSGGLSPAARDTLATMLQAMPRQDWQVVVDEFTASLAATAAVAPPRAPPVEEPTREPDRAAAAPLPPLPPAQATDQLAPAAAAVVAEQTPAARTPETPAAETLAVQNACFATRVRAWGAVDRFEHSRFLPGQEVIVYFELDQLATRESAEGHTTRVDTRLRLVAADGRKVHEWTFEPLEETCRARRRDYFARYVLALPDATPAGPCRLEISVTDAVGGRTALASLPLEMLDR